ncbi:outer membrane protein assembly factor BamD [Thioalkalivibrio sulfidiphilus]|uniref:outer membrane protein assembly factor BamD n=1 Tax=Thioalkalivibrio sulfidiphilus TaxID=1033854 RepID=UPI0022AC3830|nr:outer membrane protein assembly factor BamD [Thioalkalivibrio sulfidiphilus]
MHIDGLRVYGRVWLTAMLVSVLLAGCATQGVRPGDDDAAAYRAVSEAVAASDCGAARQALQTMQAQFPNSPRLPDARLETAYACLSGGDLAEAEELVITYLEQSPGHASEEYGRYLHALVAYARWKELPADTPAVRSAAQARQAFGRIRVLVGRYPQTAYASDLRMMLTDLREGLARLELEAIATDLQAGRHQAVISRANYVLNHYAATESAPFALAALINAHRARGEEAAARTHLYRLESDWPGHPVLQTLQ